MTVEALAKPNCDKVNLMNILASIEGGDFKLYVNYDDVSDIYSFAFTLYTRQHHTATVTGKPIACNRWYHIAGVYDGYHLSLFVDGKLEGKLVDEGLVYPPHPVSPMYMGAEYQEGGVKDYYHGRIDEARLWNYPRTQTQIIYYQYHKVACDSPYLVGYWDLDDPSPSSQTQIVENCVGEDGVLGFTESEEIYDPSWEDSERPFPPSGFWKTFNFPIVISLN
jgi:hypothetical protein